MNRIKAITYFHKRSGDISRHIIVFAMI